jgi:hypothetical protein
MDGNRRIFGIGVIAVGAALVCSGCMGLPAQILYVIYGHKVSAEYEGLNGKKVAVICVSDASAYGPSTLTFTVERMVAANLGKNVPRIQVIPQTTVDDWKDQFGWDEADFVQIGRGVGADAVLAIEITSYSLHEGSTMYKGKVTVMSTVYDVKDQAIGYRKGPETYEFPKSGHPSLHLSEREFENSYLTKLCQHLAERFYEHDRLESVAEDAAF